MRAFWKKGKRAFALGVALFSVLFGCVAAFAIAMDVGYAAMSGGLSDQDIGLTDNGDATWTASENKIEGSVISTSGCGGSTTHSGSLTLTNNKATPAKLSFEVSVALNNGSAKVDERVLNSDSSFSKTLGAGGTVKIEITSGSTDNATSIYLSNILLVEDKTVNVTFLSGEHGNYTVDGESVPSNDEGWEKSKSSLEGFELVATPESDQFVFYRWIQFNTPGEETTYSTKSECVFFASNDCFVRPEFVSAGVAQFQVKSQLFLDLDLATSYALSQGEETVILANDGFITGHHSIPKNVCLLIPFDSIPTIYKETPSPSKDDLGSTSPYRTLTMKEGSSISIEGSISVGGRYWASSGGQKGKMTGPYGAIKMENDSSLLFFSGASFYAWGFVTGTGRVSMENGSNVYEWMQILDFRGGSETSKITGLSSPKAPKKIFPFNQYAIQNVEVEMEFKAGAIERVYTGLSVSIFGLQKASILFVGTGQNKGIFNLEGGVLKKKYNDSLGRIVYTVEGSASLDSVSIKIGTAVSINSAEYVFPLTNNMSIFLSSGKLTVNQNVALLAGVECNVAQGAELFLSSGKSMYVYDSADWIGKNFSFAGNFSDVVYRPGGIKNTINSSFPNTNVDINGTFTSVGSLYTTEGGACIHSSERTGKFVQQSSPGTETLTYQFKTGGSEATAINITPAKLRDEDWDDAEKRGGTFETGKELRAEQTAVMKQDTNGVWRWTAKQTSTVITVTYCIGDLKYSVQVKTGELHKVLHSSDVPNNLDSKTALAWSIKSDFSSDTFFLPGQSYGVTDFGSDIDLYPFYGGWLNQHYYFDASLGCQIKGFFFTSLPDNTSEAVIWFDQDTGYFDSSAEGIRYFENEYYYIKGGIQSIPAGKWWRESEYNEKVRYYYFGNSTFALRDTQSPVEIDTPYYLNGQVYLPAGWYTFGPDGFIKWDDNYSYNPTDPHPLYVKALLGTDFCFFEGVKAGIGLFECDGYVYYAQKDASIFKNGTLYVADMHGITDGDKNPLTPGLYYFDDQGRMFDSSFALIDKTSSNA